jgi:drug/metabolite transporter (DMT)-like permease
MKDIIVLDNVVLEECDIDIGKKASSFDIQRAKGLFFMVISAVMTTLMNIIIKYASKHSSINVLEAIVIRSLFLVCGTLIRLKNDKVSILDIPRHLFKILFLRGLFGFISTATLY